MILDTFAPGSPVFLVFPFNNLLDLKIPGVVLILVSAALKGIPNHAGKVDNSESPPSNVNHRIPAFQGFPPGNPGGGAVKMNGLAGGPVGYGGSYIFDRLAAVRTEGMGDRLGGRLGGLPFGTVAEGQILPGFMKQKARQLIKLFPGNGPRRPLPGGNIR
jgi:hypothetical protein